jgi:hypothetical protein
MCRGLASALARVLGSRYPSGKTNLDFREMTEDPSIDAVAIAPPGVQSAGRTRARRRQDFA